MSRLQQTIGQPLLEQIGKRLFLTPAGEAVLGACQELFASLDRLETRLGRLAGGTVGRLRLGVVTTAKYLVPRYLGPFSRQFPGVDIEFNICNRTDLISRLDRNLDDLYFFSHPPIDRDIHAERLIDNPLVVIAPRGHPLAGRSALPWSALENEPFLIREPGSGTRLAVERHFHAQGWRLCSRMTIASNEAIKEAVSAGMGIAVLSRHTLHNAGSGDIVELDVAGFPIRSDWYLVRWRGKAISPVVEAFLECVGAPASTAAASGGQRPASGGNRDDSRAAAPGTPGGVAERGD